MEAELEALNLADEEDIPDLNWDRIDQVYRDVNDLYTEIRNILYGPDATDVDIDNQDWDKIYGLEGAINFLKNPACWRIGEECDFQTGDPASSDPAIVQANDDWLQKYKGIIRSTVQNAEDAMTRPGVENEIDNILSPILIRERREVIVIETNFPDI